ncbi:MAG: PilZ domain-containing protein [Xanthobacteraceae bacterium]
MAERRKVPRHKTYKAARIAFDEWRAAITCLVKNLSGAGACIAVESPIGIPDTFDLVFDSGEPGRACHVVWRTAKQIGVEFR